DITKTWQTVTLNVNATNTTAFFRRKYAGLDYVSGSDKYTASTIAVVRDRQPGYTTFEAATRLSIARAAMYQAVSENASGARFGLMQIRQQPAAMPPVAGNSGLMADADPAQQTPTDAGSTTGRWMISRPTVSANNGAVVTTGVRINADAGTANQDVLNKLAMDVRGRW